MLKFASKIEHHLVTGAYDFRDASEFVLEIDSYLKKRTDSKFSSHKNK